MELGGRFLGGQEFRSEPLLPGVGRLDSQGARFTFQTKSVGGKEIIIRGINFP